MRKPNKRRPDRTRYTWAIQVYRGARNRIHTTRELVRIRK